MEKLMQNPQQCEMSFPQQQNYHPHNHHSETVVKLLVGIPTVGRDCGECYQHVLT
jgi:hypothetical protein